MKTLILVFLAIVSCLCASLTNRLTENCQLLHKGTFRYGDSNIEVIVKIKGKKHVEFHEGGKYKIESTLDWVNECEYNMTMTKVTIPGFPHGPGDIMNVRIDKVAGNEIYYTATVKGLSWKGIFIKID